MKLVFCVEKNPGNVANKKTTSRFYLFIGTEGRRIFKIKYHHFQIQKELLKELWRVMEDSFTKIRNFTFDPFVFFLLNNRKENQLKAYMDA